MGFNCMVCQHGRLPACWKNSIVVPILKPEKLAYDANSYRPIALTSVLCKLMERLVTDRLTWHMETNHLFNRFRLSSAGFGAAKTTSFDSKTTSREPSTLSTALLVF